jgi:hypothetical protein
MLKGEDKQCPSEEDKETTRNYRKKYIFASMSNRWNWQVFDKPSKTKHKYVPKGNYLASLKNYFSNSSHVSTYMYSQINVVNYQKYHS